MAQFEYQIVEQAGGRASHLNERIMQLVGEGWEPLMMTGVSPNVSVMMRRTVGTGPARPTAAPAATAAPQPAAPTAPRPAAPVAPAPPRPPQQ